MRRPSRTTLGTAVAVALASVVALLPLPADAASAATTPPGAPRGWSDVAVPSVQVPNGRLVGVSCPTASTCVAVGGTSDGAGRPALQVQRSRDGVWGRDDVAPTTGVPALADVSCTSATWCVAVGRGGSDAGAVPLAEVWDGTTWTVEPLPPLTGRITAGLTGVDCLSAAFCVAVGQQRTSAAAATTPTGYAAVRRGGVWSVLPAPPANGDQGLDQITAVSCGSARACVAVGGGRDGNTVLDRWDGTAWTPLAARPGLLTDVDCVTATSCTAVGHAGKDSFAARITGSQVAYVAVPRPTLPGGIALTGVSCVAVSVCRASAGTSFATTDDGATWSLGATPPVSADVLDCTSADACVAVGVDSASHTSTASRWNGTSWTVQVTADPPGVVDDALGAVSCRGPGSCLALDTTTATVRVFDGTAWTLVDGPPGIVLTDVSCAGVGDCVATGQNGSTAVSARWSAGTWTKSPLAVPGGSTTTRAIAVSCWSLLRCSAVVATERGPAIEDWNGRAWSVVPFAIDRQIALTDISCPSATLCVVSGQDFLRGRGVLLERHGTAWSQAVVPPAATGKFSFSAVSCTATGSCMAVGANGPGGSQDGPFVETRTASGWQVQPPPTDPDRPDVSGGLTTVSCPATDVCTAGRSTLVSRWDGSAWTAQQTFPDLRWRVVAGLSCPTVGFCTLTGSAVPSERLGGSTVAFAQVWNR